MYISPKRIWIINATGPGQVYIYICIGPETINSLAAEHNIMRIPNRQTVMTWELESSSTAATYRQHCTLGNNGQPTFSRVHCQTSLCELWVLQLYTWWDDAMLTTISVHGTGSCTWCDSVYSTLLYMILREVAFIKGKSLVDAFSKCSVDWCGCQNWSTLL